VIYDFLIIGAGISGAALAYELASEASVLILDGEHSAGYHSTGRSAALYTPNYGPDVVKKINRLSFQFLENPPNNFSAVELLSLRGMLTVVPESEAASFASLLAAGGNAVAALDSKQTLELAPFLHAATVAGGIYEHDVHDIDVNALHNGFLSNVKSRGGQLITNARVKRMARVSDSWRVFAGNDSYKADVVINAAGAWADDIATLAGAHKIGLEPRRRTAMLVDLPHGVRSSIIPATDFYGIDNYLKPMGQQLMVSPGDATMVKAQDIQPEEMDIALLIDWVERETTLHVNHPIHSWAGLRSFVQDGLPVVGFDPKLDDFFWLAAQGGYGIMMSCALARASATQLLKQPFPADFQTVGIQAAQLSPKRLL